MKPPFHQVIGIIGGGQLGKMLIESGMSCNIQYNVLDPDPAASCKDYAKKFINAGLKNAEAINELAKHSDVLTYEIEHVNTDALLELEKKGKTIIPSPSILKIIQDKSVQKNFYKVHHLPTAHFQIVNTPADWLKVADNWKEDRMVVKLCEGGYDGKGVSICQTNDIKKGLIPFDAPCIVEQFIDHAKEIAIMVASDGDEILTWPEIEMHFDPKLNLVDYLYSPGLIHPDLAVKAADIASKAIKALNGKGVFAVELLITQDEQILINEIAPRPHNSGHHTIEASITSQYEQLNRILLNLPLGDTSLIKPAVMVNIIGPDNVIGDYKLEGVDKAMKTDGFYLHLYKKTETRPGRKMGHFTILADSIHEAIEKALVIKSNLKIVSA